MLLRRKDSRDSMKSSAQPWKWTPHSGHVVDEAGMGRRQRGHRTEPEPFIGVPRFGVLRLRSSRRMIGVGMAEGLTLLPIRLLPLEPQC
jgi:hypothetical protein